MTHVVNTKLIEGLGDLNLLLGIKKGVGELLTLTEGALDDLEAGDIAQEIRHADVVAVWVASDGGVRVLASLNGSEAGMRRDLFVYKLAELSEYTAMNHTHAIGLADAIYMPIGIGLIVGTGTHGGGVEIRMKVERRSLWYDRMGSELGRGEDEEKKEPKEVKKYRKMGNE